MPKPIISRLTTSTFLRPIRSPRMPKTTPPSGRARKPAAKVPSASSVAMKGSAALKKSLSNTSTAHMAKAKKSYHSNVVPTVLATMRLTRFTMVSPARLTGRNLMNLLSVSYCWARAF
ncbi:hypothetical protein D9M68_975890 [compost metagenome]